MAADSIIDTFPEDPSIPSLAYAAVQQTPISIPWVSKRTVALGAGFWTTRASSPNPFSSYSAFDLLSVEQCYPQFRTSHEGSYVESSTNSHGSSREHTAASLAISIGGSFIGASGRGTYDSRALSNTDANASSVRSQYHAGTITMNSLPRLSLDAMYLLSRKRAGDRHASKMFNERFGDYYVSALRIGAANATMITTSAGSSTSSKDITADATVKVLGFKKEMHWEQHEAARSLEGTVALNAFDSMDDVSEFESGSGEVNYERIMPRASQNLARSRSVNTRVGNKLHSLGLRNGQLLSKEMCDVVCREGLVTEIVLLPFSGLRDYVEAELSIV